MPERLHKIGAIAATVVIIVGCGISAQSPAPGGTTRPTGGTGTTPATTTSRPATSGPGATATAGAQGTPSATQTAGAQGTPSATETAGAPATPEGPLATPTGSVVWGNWPAYMQF